MPRKLAVQFMIGITITLLLMLGTNLILVWRQEQRDLMTEMHSKAKVMTEELIATRLFIARNQDLINGSSIGHVEFKGLNPAAVGRGVGLIFKEITGFELKQTRFRVRQPENAPDPFDWEALTRFQSDPGLAEYFRQVITPDGTTRFRYAVPLRTERECLVCHGAPTGELDIAGFPKEGLEEGELAGAISVTLPMESAIARIRDNTIRQVWVVVGVTVASLLVIFGLSRQLVTLPLARLASLAHAIGHGRMEIEPHQLALLKRSQELGIVAESMETMARSLKDLYTSLEDKVAERTRELAQANQVQSQFLATVSHELRTPLTSIIAFTELLLMQCTGQQREYLTDVLESSRRLLSMVNDLLDLSRSEAGRLQIFTDVIDLPELVIRVERSVRPLAERKSISLEVALTNELPPLLVDPLRVQQVLMNLLGNAIKFTPEGGRVTVSARTIGKQVEVTVTDTGPGVAPDQRRLIFEAFRRLEAPGNQHPGSGLGLALAKNLVELHGGTIWVEDAPRGGSAFRFTLPVAPVADDEAEILTPP